MHWSRAENPMSRTCPPQGFPCSSQCDMAAEKHERQQRRWYFTKEELEQTPSRKCGIDADKELSYRHQAANFIQDIGQRLNVYPFFSNATHTGERPDFGNSSLKKNIGVYLLFLKAFFSRVWTFNTTFTQLAMAQRMYVVLFLKPLVLEKVLQHTRNVQ